MKNQEPALGKAPASIGFGRVVVAVATVGATLAWAYAPALRAGFSLDDFPNIVSQVATHWTDVSLGALERLLTTATMPSRPLANLSFALNHLAGGLDPFGYHLVNVQVHAAVGVAVAWTTKLLLDDAQPEAPLLARWAGGALAGIVFVLHPLNSQPVIYVVQRMTLLATLFSVLAFGLYLIARRGRRGWLLGAFFLFALALLSKENAAGIAAVVVLYEVCFHRPTWRQRFAKAWRRTGARVALILGAALGVGAAVAPLVWLVQRGSLRLLEQWPHRDFNGVERMLTQARVQLQYLSLLVWPDPGRLNLDHHVEVSRSLWEPSTTAPAVAFWILAGLSGAWLVRRRPAWGFPVGAYLVLHVIESAPLGLELMFEHRMYLPTAFLVMLVGLAAQRVPSHHRSAAAASFAIVLAMMAWATHARASVWEHPLVLAEDSARKSPGKYRAVYNYGSELLRAGRYAQAVPVLVRAAALGPEASEPQAQLGSAYMRLGDYGQAVEHLQRALARNPKDAEGSYNLAVILDAVGRPSEAERHYRIFLQVAPPHLEEARHKVRARLRGAAVLGQDVAPD